MAYDSEHGKLWQDIKADVDKTRTRASKFAAAAEWAFGKKTARVLGGVALFAVVVILLFLFLNLYVAPTKPSEKKDLVLTLAQILAGTALLSGLYFTWRTLQVSREGQITERFTKAIEQLGEEDAHDKPRLEIRLGGIYALERIARDSVRDYGPILEILTAYIRENAPWPPKGASPQTLAEKEANEWSKWGRTAKPIPLLPETASDTQAILNVLRRREVDRVPTKYRVALQLQGTDLRGADLTGANLAGAFLKGANLQGAWLLRANLDGANLTGASLQKAWLSGARLTKTDFTDARLEGALLAGASIGNPTLQENRRFGREDANVANIVVQPVDLRETQGLLQEQLKLALGNLDVKLPQHLQHPPQWTLDRVKQIKIVSEQMKEQISRGSGNRGFEGPKPKDI